MSRKPTNVSFSGPKLQDSFRCLLFNGKDVDPYNGNGNSVLYTEMMTRFVPRGPVGLGLAHVTRLEGLPGGGLKLAPGSEDGWAFGVSHLTKRWRLQLPNGQVTTKEGQVAACRR